MGTPVPLSHCLGCGVEMDEATVVADDAKRTAPRDGDVSLCLHCGHIMIFENGYPRNPTSAEMYDIAGDRRIIAAQKARQTKRLKGLT